MGPIAASSETHIGWGFIGASLWAKQRMIPAVAAADDATAVAVFSTSDQRGQTFVEECGLKRAYHSLEGLLDDPEIDAVYISTTNDLHASQTIAAAAAGKHVLCEKPLALTVADANAMQAACEQAGVVFGTNHHLRGAPAIVKLRELIAQGAIGDVVAARIFNAGFLAPEFRHWRLSRPDAGGGVVLDLTVHDADTIRFLLADEVVEVTALTASNGLGNGVVEDSVMGAMRMSRGPLVCFHDDFMVPFAGTGVEVHGSSGSLVASDVLLADPGGEVWLRQLDELTRISIGPVWPLYENVVNRFMAAIRGEGEPLTSGADGVASLAIALAVLESAKQGHPVAPAT
jgi:1,5-anhydro-D-fructose reductase (1,5-anhydro-D-mannitol-forming)